MECTKCGGKVGMFQKQVGVDERKKPILHIFACCDDCGFEKDLSQEENERREEEAKNFTGVYRPTLLSGLEEVRCPRCGTEDCSHYKVERVIHGTTKARYSVNLNPLKPFTLVNKKEKSVTPDKVVTDNKFICNKCGTIFR